MSIVKVTAKGQIAIPASIRESAKIKEGDSLLIMETHGKLLLEKPKRLSKKMHDDFRDLLKHSEAVAKELWSSKEDDIWDTV